MVLCCPLLKLKDLCGIRIAYLMWTRRKLPKKSSITLEHFKELVNDVKADVLKLPLLAPWKSLVVNHVDVAGKQLLSLLSVWEAKTELEYPNGYSLQTKLFDCLMLNANGLINPRKTAEELLCSRILPCVLAFRLACINYLEKQVLKLWTLPLVKNYFLNRIGFHAEESEEVLFWIMYCLSREQSININDLPHFGGPGVKPYDFCENHAAVSGNVACFDYFKNFASIEYNYMRVIETIFSSRSDYSYSLYINELDYQQSCLIFHFALLKYEEKVELFRKYPKLMVAFFLIWPLTQTFVENSKEIWNLIPNDHKGWVFYHILHVIYGSCGEMDIYDFKPICHDTGKYFLEHLVRIWNDLWEISLESYKVEVVNKFVFEGIEMYCFPVEFDMDFSTLMEKLRQIFLSNGEVIFEFYKTRNLKESLKSLVAKYLPGDFENLDRNYISFLLAPLDVGSIPESEYRFSITTPLYSVHEKFWIYVKEILFTSSRN